MKPIQEIKHKFRIKAGQTLHKTGLYKKLLPVFLPNAKGIKYRLQSYLNHYYEQVDHAEAILYLPDLGLKFSCDIKDHMLWPYLEGQTTIYELTDIQHCLAQVKSDDHIVDIGANHGFWGFTLASRIDSNIKVYFCEANPSILKRLYRTITINPNIDASVLPYAISDLATGELVFYLPDGNLSGLGSTVLHNFATNNGWLSAERKITVPSRSLDALMDNGIILGMDIVKIDVEQAEDTVIRGGLRALKHFRPRLLMIETSLDSWGSKTLFEMGYRTYCLDKEGQKKPVESGYWGNIFFVAGDK